MSIGETINRSRSRAESPKSRDKTWIVRTVSIRTSNQVSSVADTSIRRPSSITERINASFLAQPLIGRTNLRRQNPKMAPLTRILTRLSRGSWTVKFSIRRTICSFCHYLRHHQRRFLSELSSLSSTMASGMIRSSRCGYQSRRYLNRHTMLKFANKRSFKAITFTEKIINLLLLTCLRQPHRNPVP